MSNFQARDRKSMAATESCQDFPKTDNDATSPKIISAPLYYTKDGIQAFHFTVPVPKNFCIFLGGASAVSLRKIHVQPSHSRSSTRDTCWNVRHVDMSCWFARMVRRHPFC